MVVRRGVGTIAPPSLINWAGGAGSGEIVGKFKGVSARLWAWVIVNKCLCGQRSWYQESGEGAMLFNVFIVFGVTLTGGRTKRQVAASPRQRRLVPPGAGKPRPLFAVLARSYAGMGQDVVTKYHVDVVDALVVPDKMAGHAYGDNYQPAGWGISFGLTEF